ncbi:MAG TPA: UPF0182 family protein [Longimicrobiales bacterium]|nr:UPF0182 family protein [Longimicrobiales bacterium]
MPRRPGRILLIAGVALLVLLVVGRVAVGFYTDILWHGELGYLSAFWRRFGIALGVRGAAGVLSGTVIFLNLWIVARNLGPVRVRRRYGNIEIAERIPRRHVLAAAVAIAVLGGWWLAELQFDDTAALGVAAWLRHAPFDITDPIFGRDAAFYVFTLPVLADAFDLLLLATVWSLALVALGHVLVGGLRWEENRLLLSRPARLHLAVLLAAMLVLLAARYWLGRYVLLVEGTGVRGAFGYTDAHVRLPGYWIIAGVAVTAAAAVVHGARKRSLVPPVAGLGALIAAGLLVGMAWPAAVQKFRVEPNELSREAAYIRWNIEFTRLAYGLQGIDRQRFPYRAGARPDRDRLGEVVTRLPLWDTEPVRQGLNQEQVLFRYYQFPSVDYDRYGPEGDEVQVAIGVREFNLEGLEGENPTWQSLRLNPNYIRGIGAVVAPAHIPGEGGPDLWVQDIPPIVARGEAPEGLVIRNPSVFFGETAQGYAVVVPGRDSAFTGEPGVDFPEGVPLSSFLRVLAFAWRFGDETLLFSGDIGRDSRLIFRRSLRERVQGLAPFVVWDGDPLPVIADGRIIWMLDGYTASSSFPLSRSVSLGGLRTRYLRNAVKATVDAVTGAVEFYAMDDADPILTTYRRLFPEFFHPAAELPPSLRDHLRYPALALVVQAEILQEYHVDRAEVFYAEQDVWQRPEESALGGGLRDYRPTYALVPVPLGQGVAYLAMMPFIARSRQNMTAILVARNDARRYGELSLVEFPRDLQVPGPAQVQAMIEQDDVIAPELSLLRQRGSGVEMGHLRVIALDSTILFVQPLFLSADENPIPEIWNIVASDGRRVAMGPDLGAALAGLQLPVDARAVPRRGTTPSTPARSVETGGAAGAAWPQRAIELLDRAEARLREGDWAGYGRLLEELRAVLQRADEETAPAAGG